MTQQTKADFECPCGRMTMNDCAGECAIEGKCVVCGQPSAGAVNSIPICLDHFTEVSTRIFKSTNRLMRQVFE